MPEQIDIKEIERKAYTTISQDGFDQMLIGLILLGFAISVIIPNDSFFAGIFVSIIYGVYCLITSIVVKHLRKRISYSRIGYVKTKQGKQDVMLIFVLAAVLFFVIFSIVCIEMNLRNHPVRLFGFVVPFSVGASVYGFLYHDRLWFKLAAFYLAYGIVLFMIPVLDFDATILLVYVGLGVITFVSGIIRLHRFLTTHSRIAEETAHVA